MILKCVLWFFGVLSLLYLGYFFWIKNWKWDLVWGCWKVFEFFVCYFDIKEYKGNILFFLYVFCKVKCNFIYLCKWIVRIFFILFLFGSELLLFCRWYIFLSFIKVCVKILICDMWN